MWKCKRVARPRQTFVYQTKALLFNDLWVRLGRLPCEEGVSESLGESGLRHSAGKTFPSSQVYVELCLDLRPLGRARKSRRD